MHCKSTCNRNFCDITFDFGITCTCKQDNYNIGNVFSICPTFRERYGAILTAPLWREQKWRIKVSMEHPSHTGKNDCLR